ncbi:MAG: cytochrome c biogenesis protein CcsA [Planctomycetes bacterium]|nr:cytochrome c biogenesis protein CcsA [Planctomycetota bacterium]
MMPLAAFHAFRFDPALGPAASFLLHGSILLFFVAAALAVLSQLVPGKVKLRWADATGAAATALLVGFFVARFIEAGSRPLGNMFEIVAMSGLVLAVAYLAASRLKPIPAVGAFAFPLLAVIFGVDYLLAPTFARAGADGPSQPLLVAHIVLVVLSYGVFLLATMAAVMSLVQERQLKQHRDTPFIRSFPPQEALRKLVHTCLLIGLPVLTVGFVLGFVSFTSADWAALPQNPKIIASLVLWLVLVAALVGRATGLLHGRRHLYLVLAGFVLVIFSFVGLGLIVQSRSQQVAALAEGRA